MKEIKGVEFLGGEKPPKQTKMATPADRGAPSSLEGEVRTKACPRMLENIPIPGKMVQVNSHLKHFIFI